MFVQIEVAACRTCHREKSLVSEIIWGMSEQEFIRATGVLEGEISNYLDGVSCSSAEQFLVRVKNAMLDDPMKYLTISRKGMFESGSYEKFVGDISRFIDDCHHFPDAKLKVTS